MKKLYVTALMVSAVIFGLLLVGCPDDDNDSTPAVATCSFDDIASTGETFDSSRVWNQAGGAVLERSAITKNVLTKQDSGATGYSRLALTVNGLTDGDKITLVGGGATPEGGSAEIGIFPVGADLEGNGIRFLNNEQDDAFPTSFQQTVANNSVTFQFCYRSTDLSGWSSSFTFENDVMPEVAFRLEVSDSNATIFTAEESSGNYYVGGIGANNSGQLTINLGGTVAYNLQTVNKNSGDFTATHTAGTDTDNGGNIRLNLNITGIDTSLAGSQLAVAGTYLRYLDGSNYTAEGWFNNTPNDGLRCTISSTGTCDLTVFWDPDDANKGDSGNADQDYSSWNSVTGAMFVVKLNLITQFSTVESFIYPTDHGQYYVTADDSSTAASKIYGGATTIDAGDTIAVSVSLAD